jgi:hypothetical protein
LTNPPIHPRWSIELEDPRERHKATRCHDRHRNLRRAPLGEA